MGCVLICGISVFFIGKYIKEFEFHVSNDNQGKKLEGNIEIEGL
jgi:hypothetical protein